MFRRNRRTPGRHTEAYLSRRATSAAADQATVETTEALPEATLPTPTTEAEVVLTPADLEVDLEADGVHVEGHHGPDGVLCGRCETLVAGDELNALRAKRAAGAA